MNEVANLGAITDDSRNQVEDHSKRVAIDNLYLAVSQALGNAAHNAVNSQQQFSVLLQAATTQSIMQIYSIDTASPEADANKISRNNLSTSLDSSAQENIAAESGDSSIQAESSDYVESFPSRGQDISREIDTLMESFSKAMRAISDNQLRVGKELVKQSLATEFLLKMIESPEKYDPYLDKILDKIDQL